METILCGGGSAADWIFGGADNDVMSGGNDQDMEDLIFGGAGDDIFQIIPSERPNTTTSDQYFGDVGDDQVLFVGGGLAGGKEVPDDVAIRWNRNLQRYELSALQWDINNQIWDQIWVEKPGGGQNVLNQVYAYYQTQGVEHTVIDTLAGNDVVRADPEFKYPYSDEEWGLSAGDFNAGALLSRLEIYGGSGNDIILGSGVNDLIDGEEGDDTIEGGGGSDHIVGGSGSDSLFGGLDLNAAKYDRVTEPQLKERDLYQFRLIDGDSYKPRTLYAFDLDQMTYKGHVESTGDKESIRQVLASDDLTGDGQADLVLAGSKNTYVMFGPVDMQGSSNLKLLDEAALIISSKSFLAAVGDVDGDARDELILVSLNQQSLDIGFLSLDDLSRAKDFPREVKAETFPDVSRISYWKSIQKAIPMKAGSKLEDFTLTTLDWNGDGKLDVVLAGPDGTGKIYSADGKTLATLVPTDVTVSGARVVSVGDLDGDAQGDLIINDATTKAAYVLLGKSEGVYSDLNKTAINGTVSALGDISADGYDDFALSNDAGAQIVLGGRRLAGSIPFVTKQLTLADAGGLPLALTSGDFNGDRSADLAIGSGDGVRVLYDAADWIGNDSSSGPIVVSTSGVTGLIRTPFVDLTGDGDDDLLLIAGDSIRIIKGGAIPQSPEFAVPPTLKILSNETLGGTNYLQRGGAGSFVVQDTLPDDSNGKWYKFRTMGDGDHGERIVVSPGFQPPIVRTPHASLLGKKTVLEFDLGLFLSSVGNGEAIEDASLALDWGVDFTDASVSIAASEGDGFAEDADRGRLASQVARLKQGENTIDLREAIRSSLNQGFTRVTLMVELSGSILPSAEKVKDQSRLTITPRSHGFLADLHAENGTVVSKARSIIDLRTTKAGTYYLKVYRGSSADDSKVSFTLDIVAPNLGNAHPIPDNDRIEGGDGNDKLVGGSGLDRLFDTSGADVFVAEPLEILSGRDSDKDEINTPTADWSNKALVPAIDVSVADMDVGLRGAIAVAMAWPTTVSWDGKPIIHKPAAGADQRVWASELAEVRWLDASSRQISKLDGIEFLTNLEFLNLANNQIVLGGDGSQLNWLSVSHRSDDGPYKNIPTGLWSLQGLAVDRNASALSSFDPLEALHDLIRLSADGQQLAVLAPLAKNGLIDRLELLSVDSIPRLQGSTPALTDLGFLRNLNTGHNQLAYLSLMGNRIGDDKRELLPLTEISKLRVLRLDNNPVSDIEVLTGRRVIDDDTRVMPNVVRSPDGRYEAKRQGSGDSIHYEVTDVKEGRVLLTTRAKFTETPNDVKAGAFSADSKYFFAAYHYGHESPRTWIGQWNLSPSQLGADGFPIYSDNPVQTVEHSGWLTTITRDLTPGLHTDIGAHSIVLTALLVNPEFSVSPRFTSNLDATQSAMEGDYRFVSGQEGGMAQWNFRDLTPGTYDVFVSWPESASQSSRSPQAVYTLDVDTSSLLEGGLGALFEPISPTIAAPLAGSFTVVINTDQVDDHTQFITGDDGDQDTFFGKAFTSRVIDGKAQIYVAGDLEIPAGTITVTGSRPLSLLIGNNALVEPGVVIDASAVGQNAGAGGGSGGVGGMAGTGGQTVGKGGIAGGGGSGGPQAAKNPNLGGDGGRGTAGTNGAGGTSGLAGSAGLPAYLNDAIGVGGARTAPGIGGWGGAEQAGGRGGKWSSAPGAPGKSEKGGSGGQGSNGIQGKGGSNSLDGDILTGGTGGGGGSGGAGGGAGGGGSGGSGGGGGASASGHKPTWSGNKDGGGGGDGGRGGAGGLGGSGGSGGNGGTGGGGGGAFEIVAEGGISIGSASSFLVRGGDGAGGSNAPADSSSGRTDGTNGMQSANWKGHDGHSSSGGTGGKGGDGATGGKGGDGGAGGTGGAGGGGAGGTVRLVGSVVTGNITVDVSGGRDGKGNPSGGAGRWILGSNAGDVQVIKSSALTQSIPTKGSQGINPYIASFSTVSTPNLVGLEGGAAPYGLLPKSVKFAGSLIGAATREGAGLALIRLDGGVENLIPAYAGYDLLLLANLSDSSLTGVQLGAGQTAYLTDLLQSGYLNDDPTVDGDGPIKIDLESHRVFATLIPEQTLTFSVLASQGDDRYVVSDDSLQDGKVLLAKPLVSFETLDQTMAPQGDSFLGQPWQKLPTPLQVTTRSDHSLTLPVFRASDGHIVTVDGAMLKRTDVVLPELQVLGLTGAPLDNRAMLEDGLRAGVVVKGGFVSALETRPESQGGPVDVRYDVNQAPRIAGIADTWTSVRVTASDPDNRQIAKIRATSNIDESLLGLKVEGNPDSGYILKMLPYAGFPGTAQITVTAYDGHGRSAETSFEYTNGSGKTIYGLVWQDTNGNGQRNVSEPGRVEGALVFLDQNADQKLNANEPRTYSDIDGAYALHFDSPAAGSGPQQLVYQASDPWQATRGAVSSVIFGETAPETIVIEGESSSATGPGRWHTRTAASGLKAWWLHEGETRTWTFDVQTGGEAQFRFRTSNDSAPASVEERIQVSVDGKSLGEFVAKDSGTRGWGYDWNTFIASSALGPVDLSAGPHKLEVKVVSGDFHGVEIDKIDVTVLSRAAQYVQTGADFGAKRAMLPGSEPNSVAVPVLYDHASVREWAVELKAAGRYAEALSVYDQVIAGHPEDVLARNGRAEVLKLMGRFDDALKAYEEVIGGYPNNVAAKNGRAEVLKVMSRYDQALAAYEAVIAAYPDDVSAKNGRVEVLKVMGRYGDALSAYEAVIAAFPTDVVAMNGRAEVLKLLKRYGEALAAYETVMMFVHPGDLVAQLGRAEVLKLLERYDLALLGYEAVLSAHPEEVLAQNGRAEVLKLLKRYGEALAAYEAVLASHPQEVVAQIGRAGVLSTMGRYEEALAAYEAILAVHPDDMVARNGRAEVLQWLGRPVLPLAAYEPMFAANSERVVALDAWAEVLTAGDESRDSPALAVLGGFVDESPLIGSDSARSELSPPDRIGVSRMLLGDRFEENDSAEAATDLGTVSGNRTETLLSVETNDPDWFRINLASRGRIGDKVAIDFQHALGDVDLYLYDAQAQTLLARSDGFEDHEEISLDGLSSGEYLVLVNTVFGASNPEYSLSVTTSPAPTGDRLEDDDSPQTATNLGLLEGSRSEGSLSIEAADSDWFRLQLGALGREADRIAIDFLHAQGDLSLFLFAGDGGSLIASSTGSADHEEVSLSGVNPGVYLLQVVGQDGASNPDYSLHIAAPPIAIRDRFEDNDTPGSASALGLVEGSRSESGLSVEAHDPDWYRFRLGAKGSAGNKLAIDFQHSQGDLDVYLFDAAGNVQLAASDGVGNHEEIGLTGFLPGDYLVLVAGYAGVRNPNYTLTFEASAPSASDDRLEPDDTPQTPTVLGAVTGIVSQIDLNVVADDPDWFRFTLDAPGRDGDRVAIDFGDGEADLRLRLFSATDATPISSAGAVAGHAEISLAGIAAGDYLVEVAAAAASGRTSYGLTVVAEPGNHEPIVSKPISARVATEDSVVTLFIPFDVFTDFDGDSLSLAMGMVGGGPLPAWLVFDPESRTCAGIPENQDVGTMRLTVTASDEAGASASTEFALEVINTADAPVVAIPLADQQAVKGNHFSLTLPASAFVDVDRGDRLDYAAAQVDGSELPAWLTFDPSTRRLFGTPAGDAADDVSLMITATDRSGLSVSDVFVLTVNDDPGVPALAPDRWEGNDTGDTAASLGPVVGFRSESQLSIEANDRDWFRFSIGSKGQDGDYVAISFRPSLGDLDLSLYDASGTMRLDSSVDYGGYEEISLAGLLPGDYLVLVGAANGLSNPDYTLRVRATSSLTGDRLEEDDSALSATRLGLLDGHHSEGALSIEAGDPDWFSFRLGTFGRQDDRVAIDLVDSDGDLNLALFSGDGATELARSDSFTGHAEISLGDLSPAEYLVRVGGAARTQNSVYSLTIDAPPAEAADRFEENDSASSATGLGVINGTRTESRLSIEQGDSDWFRFTLNAKGKAGDKLALDFLSSAGDLDLLLYDVAGTKALGISNDSASHEEISLAGLLPGEYNLLVYGVSGVANPDYSLSLTASGAPPGGDRFEDDDTAQTATELGILDGRWEDRSLAVEANDPDWIRFALGSQGREGDRVTLDFAHADGDLNLYLYYSDGSSLLGFSDSVDDGEEISLEGVYPGTYLLKVEGRDGASNALYSLGIVAPPAEIRDRFEDNDHAYAATSIGPVVTNRSESGLSIESFDADWYRFALGSAGEAGDKVMIDFEESWGALDLALYDASGSSLLGVANGAGGHEEISLSSLPTGEYMVAVYSSSNQANSEYALSFAWKKPDSAPTVVNAIGEQAATEHEAFTFQLPPDSFVDADIGDRLVFRASRTDGSSLPDWLSFDATSMIFTGTPGDADVGTLRILVTAADLAHAEVSDAFNITVSDVNDAPQGFDSTITLRLDFTYVVGISDFGFSDPVDSLPNALLAVRIAELPQAGRLELSGVPVIVDQWITAADIDAGKLSFTSVENPDGSRSDFFSFHVQDDGGIANGGKNTDPVGRTLTFDLTAVNHSPEGSDAVVTVDEDGSYRFAVSDFGFADPDDDPPDELLSVTITTLPVTGTLRLNGLDVGVGQVIAAGDIGDLVYAPAANTNGAGHATFAFLLQDTGGISGGGADTDSLANTITIDVTPVNDAPTFDALVAQVVDEGGLLRFTVSASDLEHDAFLFSLDVAPSGATIDASNGLFAWTAADGPRSTSVVVRATDARGAFATAVVDISVRNIEPAIRVRGAESVYAQERYTLHLVATDPGQDSITAWHIDWGDGETEDVIGNPSIVEHTYAVSGATTISAVAVDEDGSYSSNALPVEVMQFTALTVSSFTPTPTGFELSFSRAVAPIGLNLYDSEVTRLGAPDLTLVGLATGMVKGSLRINADGQGLTFVRTGGVLEPDIYTVSLESGAQAFRDIAGRSLDGDGDGIVGGAFKTRFTIGPAGRTLSIPDFMRGPGQRVDLTAPSQNGFLPLYLSEGAGVTSVDFVLKYDLDKLVIQTWSAGADLPRGASITQLPSVEGVLAIHITSPTALRAGKVHLLDLQAFVPSTAAYGAKQVLDLDEVLVNGQDATDDDALQVVGYFGDTSGDATYTTLDGQQVQRVLVKLDSGFAAYRNVDPLIIADINGSGTLTSIDASRVLQEAGFLMGAAGSVDRAEIPPIPAGVGAINFSGPDPLVDVPIAATADRGAVVTVPVRIDTALGLESAQLRIAYDASRFELLEVRRGSISGDFGWFIASTEPGRITVDMTRLAALAGGAGTLLDIDLRVRADALPGVSPIDLQYARLNDGHLTLGVLPKAGADETDGRITVAAQAASGHPEATAAPLSAGVPQAERVIFADAWSAAPAIGGPASVTPVIDLAASFSMPAAISEAIAIDSVRKPWLKDYLGNVGQARPASPNTGLKVSVTQPTAIRTAARLGAV